MDALILRMRKGLKYVAANKNPGTMDTPSVRNNPTRPTLSASADNGMIARFPVTNGLQFSLQPANLPQNP